MGADMHQSSDKHDHTEPPADAASDTSPERRRALMSFARFGAYTAPALLAMLTAAKAQPGTGQ
jgi:hypothetical protein